jgi:protease PrsW
VLAVPLALLPVAALLLGLFFFDNFKLVPRAALITALAAGALAAMVALMLHGWLFAVTGFGPRRFARTIAPFTEETLKTLCLVYPLSRAQIGFLVDAAIIGAAIGGGFALVENVEYLYTLSHARIWVWIVRGFGTALMHASTTAIVAVAAKALRDRYPSRGLELMLPGWLLAVTLHATFNRALVSPLLAAAVLLIVIPFSLLAVFQKSERITREWIGHGLDLDVELLRLVRSSEFGSTRLGRYLTELQARFPGPVVADMFCLLQIELELAIRAKGMLMAREAGLEVTVDDDVRAALAERAYLQRAIGPAGALALRPLQVTGDRDEWHRYLLRSAKR